MSESYNSCIVVILLNLSLSCTTYGIESSTSFLGFNLYDEMFSSVPNVGISSMI